MFALRSQLLLRHPRIAWHVRFRDCSFLAYASGASKTYRCDISALFSIDLRISIMIGRGDPSRVSRCDLTWRYTRLLDMDASKAHRRILRPSRRTHRCDVYTPGCAPYPCNSVGTGTLTSRLLAGVGAFFSVFGDAQAPFPLQRSVRYDPLFRGLCLGVSDEMLLLPPSSIQCACAADNDAVPHRRRGWRRYDSYRCANFLAIGTYDMQVLFYPIAAGGSSTPHLLSF